MGGFIEFVEFAHQIDFFYSGYPFPISNNILKDGEAVVFKVIVEAPEEGAFFRVGVAEIVDGL